MKSVVYYKNRDTFGVLEVTAEYFKAGFFKTKKYLFADVKAVRAIERKAVLSEKLVPAVAGTLLMAGAAAIMVFNPEGFFCAAVLGLLGLSFLVMAFLVKNMFDISITMINGEIKSESLPANYRDHEFIEAIQKVLSEK